MEGSINRMRQSLTQLHTEPFAAEREWTVDGIPVLSAAVSLPQPVPAADKVSRRIHRYYQLQARSFLRYCDRWLFPQAVAEYRAALASSAPLPSLKAELSYRVTYNNDGFWSLYTQSRESGLPGPALLTRLGDTWDLSSGYPVPLSSFFPSKSSWKRQLLHQAEAEIIRQEKAGVSRYHESWRRELRRRFNPRHFYLSEEGIVWFYSMYAIAPAAEGIPSFVLPFEAVRNWQPSGAVSTVDTQQEKA
jgi:hypothetical protein